jgi:hypothetical protein
LLAVIKDSDLVVLCQQSLAVTQKKIDDWKLAPDFAVFDKFPVLQIYYLVIAECTDRSKSLFSFRRKIFSLR